MNFITEFYNELYNNGIHEPRLLVNHALLAPLTPDFCPQEQYIIADKEFSDVEEFAISFKELWKHNRATTKAEDIQVLTKKVSAPGFPFELASGEPYIRKDVTYGDVRSYTDPTSHLRVDYSEIKRGYLPSLPTLFQNMRELAQTGISESNIVDTSMNLTISNNVNGFRFNSIDKPNIDGLYKGEMLYGKDRSYMEWHENEFESGMLDVKKFAEMTTHLFPQRFSPQRLRPINASCWITGVPHQIDAQLFLKPIENSKNGFLSDSITVKDAYKNFLDSVNSDELVFMTGDRINAELSITTNFDKILPIIPSSHRELFKVFNTHVKWTPVGPKIMEGLFSGTGWTTGINVIVGMYEACHMISVLTKKKMIDVSTAYVHSIVAGKDFARIGEYKFKLFLPTDDVPCVVAGPITDKDMKRVEDDAKNRLMEVELNRSGFVTFGMHVNKIGTLPASISQYSKIFYAEQPGYFNKDVYSMSQRFQLVEQTDLIDFLLKKHFDIGTAWYDTQAPLFLQDLESLGLNLEDVLNEFAPKDQLIISKYAGDDPLFSSQRVEVEHLINIIDTLRVK